MKVFLSAIIEDKKRVGIFNSLKEEISQNHSLEARSKKQSTLSESTKSGITKKAIITSDCCIFEVTTQDIDLGYQIYLSLQKSKPTLVLMDKKFGDPSDIFIGFDSKYLIAKNYSNNHDLRLIVSKFLKESNIESRVRFHLVVDKSLDDYIEWASTEYKITKTDVIKNSLQNTLENDRKYRLLNDNS